MCRWVVLMFVCLFSGAFSGSTAWAQTLRTPSGPVLLTVDGPLSVSNVPEGASFDLPMLEALGETSFTTETIWTEGEQTFTGVSLHRLLDALGVEEGSLRAVAINEYWVEIPVSDAEPDGPIIAWARNGKPMSVRDKGPLWVVYPYDDNPDYRSEIIFSRSIWQLKRIEIEP